MSSSFLRTALRVPGGNQVDGLPPARHTKTVAKRGRLSARTQVHLTMEKLFLKMSAAMKVLGNDEFVLEHILKFIEIVPKNENDFAISEFYPSRTFAKVEK